MTDLVEHSMDIAPHGQLLVLRPREPGLKPRANAVSEMLMKYVERPTPFVAILVDLAGIEYRFSSADVGILVATIAAWVRGWVAPCAIVMTGQAADELRKILDITQLSSLEQLQVVETRDLGLEHIARQLGREQHGRNRT
jgi:hypothetical protein